MHKVVLKTGREKSVLHRHPWLFSGALQDVKKGIARGETVNVVSSDGKMLAKGAYSPESQIRVRIWSFDPAEEIDSGFFHRRIHNAVDLRKTFIPPGDTACRLINAESDGLPGVTVDRYADFLVCQFLSAGADHFKQEIVRQLQEILAPAGIYERSDVEIREKEGLTQQSGALAGGEPPEMITVIQGGIRFLVDVRKGHKTGMYLDQRENRHVVQQLASGKEILNCFAYTGGFALAALRGGAAKVTDIESSADAIGMIVKQADLNGLADNKLENVQGDVFAVLRQYREAGRKFDMVILDPPKFVNSAEQLKRGCRGYKDINLLAMQLLRENGLLVTFSCSGHLSPELFQKIVADAAVDAKRDARMITTLGQPADHPVALNFPEGRYLKGLVCSL
jgi:23S rRNA (cytosine1962-C5)-methyltransferase